MEGIEVGDVVVLINKVPESRIYPFAKEGAVGVVIGIAHQARDYPFQVMFPGEHTVDPMGHSSVVLDPALLFNRDEIELKEK